MSVRTDGGPRVGVIDVGLGNIGSVLNMLRHIEVPAVRVSQPAGLDDCDALLLPGVGHFDAGRRRLRETGMDEAVVASAKVRPLLGICLGMQLLTEGSEEGGEPGLGLIQGRCVRLEAQTPDGAMLPVPHMGWNEVCFSPGVLDLEDSDQWRFYFVHSYGVRADGPEVAATTTYGTPFASVVQAGQVVGAQFHPEKSHRYGMRFLTAWVRQC